MRLFPLNQGTKAERLSDARALDTRCQPHSFQGIDEIPSDVRLPPVQPEPRRAGVRMVVLVPVFSPGRQLKRAQPPDVLARIALFGMAKVREAIHEALHVK